MAKRYNAWVEITGDVLVSALRGEPRGAVLDGSAVDADSEILYAEWVRATRTLKLLVRCGEGALCSDDPA